ncbi:MAG: hypothetical protein AB1451_01635 [Nitrospirota bacterium]
MRDPHVERLHYTIESQEGVAYENPPPLSQSHAFGEFRLQDGRLTVTLRDHFADELAAREAVDPVLRDWAIGTDLRLGIGTIRFTFDKADVVDRNPPPPGTVYRFVSGVATLTAGSATLKGVGRAVHSKYPDLLTSFQATPEVMKWHKRWTNLQKGREPLSTFAYALLSHLEARTGEKRRVREKAAEMFKIDLAVLDKLGNLSGESRGDLVTGRKFKAGTPMKPLDPSEEIWLKETVRRVIFRLGEHAVGGPLTPITLGDLPRIWETVGIDWTALKPVPTRNPSH